MKKFNRAETFAEVDRSNKRFNYSPKEERCEFLKKVKELIKLSKDLAEFEEKSKKANLIVGGKPKKKL